VRPYGSKRSFDTEPRIKSARALVKREGEAIAEEQIDSETDQEEVDALDALEASASIAPYCELKFTCRLCNRKLGDFWYCPTEDACAFCVGVEFPP